MGSTLEPYEPPRVIREQRVRCLLFYLVSNIVVGLMVYAVPEGRGHAHRVDALVTMVVFQVLCCLVLLSLQGSDPGYVSKAMAEELIERAGLLTACEEGRSRGAASHLSSSLNGGAGGEGVNGTLNGGDLEQGPAEKREEEWEEEEEELVVSPSGQAKRHHHRHPERRSAGDGITPIGNSSSTGAAAAVAARGRAALLGSVGSDGGAAAAAGQQQQQGEGGMVTGPGWCNKCEMRMPLRTVHCRECGRCVSVLDHHCFCIGTCIGEKNHQRFWLFLLVQNAAVISAIRVVDTGWVRAADGTDWVLLNCLPLSTSILLWGMQIFVGLLLGAHTFFALSSTTTYECGRGPERVWYLRGTQDFDLPFSQGCIGNLRGFCFERDGCWARLMGRDWRPTAWKPGPIVRDSEDVFEHPWRNRYWSCC